MIRNNEGLTKTYNRFHDPDERSPDIFKLRELHAAMDRAVLDAYGWTDLKPACEFLLDYEDEEDQELAALPFFGASIPGFVGLLTGRGPFSPAFALIPGRSELATSNSQPAAGASPGAIAGPTTSATRSSPASWNSIASGPTKSASVVPPPRPSRRNRGRRQGSQPTRDNRDYFDGSSCVSGGHSKMHGRKAIIPSLKPRFGGWFLTN